MRILFFGTPQFAVPVLEKLLGGGHQVLGVVTSVDQPAGRGLKLAPSPVKQMALALNLPVFQPTRVNDPDFLAQVVELAPEVNVVAAYGQFLPLSLLHLPRHQTLNVHPSLLPKYRGAAPVNWALINGERETGVSIIYLTQEMDAGDILARRTTKIEVDDDSQTLSAKLAALGSDCLLTVLEAITQNKIVRLPQDKTQVTFAPPLKKEMGRLIWNKPAGELHNLVRGLNPQWSTTAKFRGEPSLKIRKTQLVETLALAAAPGTIVALEKKLGPLVSCGTGGLILTAVQLPGKSPISGEQFIQGQKVQVGERLF